MQVEDRPGPFVSGVHLDVVPVPDAEPGALVATEQLGEVGRSGHGQACVVAAFGDSAITRGIERDDLLHCHRLPRLSCTVRSWAMNPGSSITVRPASMITPSRSSLVRAVRATCICDWLVST